jgi:hypothetical protein
MKAESMNTSTEQNINEAIDWLQQTGGKIQDFAAEQAPLYCREVVAWEFWNATVYLSIGIIVFFTCCIGLFLARKEIKKSWDECDPGWPGCAALMALAAIGGLAMFADNIGTAIKAAVAPRLVIVEHLRGLNK